MVLALHCRRVGSSRVDIWTDGEDDGKKKLEFLLGHCLQVHGIVVWLHANFGGIMSKGNFFKILMDMDCQEVQAYLKRMNLWRGHTSADLQILTVEIPKPVMARYSSGAETL